MNILMLFLMFAWGTAKTNSSTSVGGLSQLNGGSSGGGLSAGVTSGGSSGGVSGGQQQQATGGVYGAVKYFAECKNGEVVEIGTHGSNSKPENFNPTSACVAKGGFKKWTKGPQPLAGQQMPPNND